MNWERLNRQTILETAWIRVFRDDYKLPDGNKIEEYYVVARDDFVLVLAERDDSLVLVRQFRAATGRVPVQRECRVVH